MRTFTSDNGRVTIKVAAHFWDPGTDDGPVIDTIVLVDVQPLSMRDEGVALFHDIVERYQCAMTTCP